MSISTRFHVFIRWKCFQGMFIVVEVNYSKTLLLQLITKDSLAKTSSTHFFTFHSLSDSHPYNVNHSVTKFTLVET